MRLADHHRTRAARGACEGNDGEYVGREGKPHALYKLGRAAEIGGWADA
jgi:hypothetical protein